MILHLMKTTAAVAPMQAGYVLVPGKHFNVGIITCSGHLQLIDMVQGFDTIDMNRGRALGSEQGHITPT